MRQRALEFSQKDVPREKLIKMVEDTAVMIDTVLSNLTEADLLKVAYTIYYDPLVMNSDGELIADDTIKPVELAINNYIQNLPFNGILNLNKLYL